MTAAVFKSSSPLTNSASAATITPSALNAPGSNSGDLLVCIIDSKNNVTHVTATAGWTKLGSTINSGASFCSSIFWARAPVSMPVITWTGAAACHVQVLCFASVDDACEIGASSSNSGSVAARTSTAITTTGNNSLVLQIDVGASTTTSSAPTGWTQLGQSSASASASEQTYNTKTIATSGTSSGATSVSVTAASWVEWQVEVRAIAPAAGLQASELEVGAWLDPADGLSASEVEVGAWLDPGLRVTKTYGLVRYVSPQIRLSKQLAYVRYSSERLRVSKTYGLVRYQSNPLIYGLPFLQNLSNLDPPARLATSDGLFLTLSDGTYLTTEGFAPTFTGGPAFSGQTLTFGSRISSSLSLKRLTVQRIKKNGHVDPGGNPHDLTQGTKYATQVTLDAGTVTSLAAYANVAGTFNTRMAIYADSAGEPGALLGDTVTLGAVVKGYNTFTMNTPYVQAGSIVWLAIHSDGDFNTLLITGSNTSRENDDVFSDGISNPFGSATTVHNKAPVYAVVLEAAAKFLDQTGISNTQTFYPLTFPLGGFALTRTENSQSFHGPIFEPGPVSIDPPKLTNTQTFHALTYSPGAVAIDLTRFSGTSSFSPLTLAPGAVEITLAETVNTQTFQALELDPGPVDLTLVRFANTQDFGSPEFDPGPVNITTTRFAVAHVFHSLIFHPGPVEIDLTSFTDPGATFFDPTFHPGAVSLHRAATFNLTDFSPATFHPGPVDIHPVVFTAGATFFHQTLIDQQVDPHAYGFVVS